MMGWFSWLYYCLLLFLINFPSPLNSLSSSSLPSPFLLPPPLPQMCHPHESSALLRFKNSFSITNSSGYFPYCYYLFGHFNPNSTISWDVSRDCCTWSGVTCDEVTGHIIRLDLRCGGLQGILHSNNSLFFLTHLQSLSLSGNALYGPEISSEFGRFASLTHLDLSYNYFTGQVPLELSYLSNLVMLDLSNFWDFNFLRLETSNMKRIVANLTHLRELRLRKVNMSSISPKSFLNLSTSLTFLDLGYSGLKGEFLEYIFHLPNLQRLYLNRNPKLTGSFPKYNWSSPLRALNLSQSGFLIDLPYLTKTLKSLSSLFLSQCNFVGSYPALLGNFTQITQLDLSYNNFGGQIPWTSLNLKQLTRLDLRENNFIGHLPEICNASTKFFFLCDSLTHQLVGPVPLKLEFLHLGYNFLNGTLPTWLYSLPSLRLLFLGYNKFTGYLDDFQYNSLTTLVLTSNNLRGPIPRSIFKQSNLLYLLLASNNFSTVQLDQFWKLKYLEHLDLSFNSLSFGSINNINYTLPDTLLRLNFSWCDISEFPYSLLRSLKRLLILDLSNNRIQGYLPLPPPSIMVFVFSNNQLVGELSSLFCNISQIQVLDLSNNSLSGTIPPCIGNFSIDLSVLDLQMNKFHGMIPPAFAKGNFLRTLNLYGNQLEGSIPHSLLNCRKLEVLDVGNNKLNGSFPWWLESLPELQVLTLRSNRFYGTIDIPKERFPFQKLRIIDLSNNDFKGTLPTKYFENFVGMMNAHADDLEYMGNYYVGTSSPYYQDSVVVAMKGLDIKLVKIQTMFITIDFSRNNFIGDISKLIGKLNSLKGLNLSHNKLNGSIPPSLRDLSNLEWLDLSSNELVGKIPWQLATYLNQLGFLNLSNNKLEGPIPRGPQFDTFKDDSYNGNVRLCGFPLTKPCNEDAALQPLSPTFQQEGEDEEHANGFDWKVVVMGYASGMVIGISLGYIVLTDKTIDWLLNILRLVKRSNRNAHPNGGIRRRN